MVVYSTFQFCLLLRPGKETNTVYSTKLISPETRFLYILFPTITKGIENDAIEASILIVTAMATHSSQVLRFQFQISTKH